MIDLWLALRRFCSLQLDLCNAGTNTHKTQKAFSLCPIYVVCERKGVLFFLLTGPMRAKLVKTSRQLRPNQEFQTLSKTQMYFFLVLQGFQAKKNK